MRTAIFSILFFALAGSVFAGPTDIAVTSGTCTLDARGLDAFGRDSRIVALVFSWTSDSSGRVTVSVPDFHGTIRRVVTNPGSAAPTDDWDVAINDQDGIDLLNTKGTNRDTSTTESFTPFTGDGTNYTPMVMAGTSTLLITNAGSAKTGTITIYLER